MTVKNNFRISIKATKDEKYDNYDLCKKYE